MSAPTPRPGILDISPYVGGKAKAAGFANPVRLASNENPFGPSPAAVEAFRETATQLHRYPDGGSGELSAAIAAVHGIDAERIVCGNGSDELICNLVRAYAGPGDEVLYSAHGFLMYPLAARAVGAVPVAVPEHRLTADVDALLAHVSSRTRLLFLANPNNPTGSYLSRSALERLRAALPTHVLLVIDAAYAEYVTRNDYEDGLGLVAQHDTVVMTRTFSKIHGLAALRLGWAYAGPAVTDVLHRLRMPFNVNLPAQAAGVAAIQDRGHVSRARTHNEQCLPRFRERMLALGLDAPESVANFQLVRFPEQTGPRSAQAAHDALAAQGILTRAMHSYGLPDCLRVTIGAAQDMDAAADAISAFLQAGQTQSAGQVASSPPVPRV